MTKSPGATVRPSGVFRRLLVGFDGSNEARHALRMACSLAVDIHGEVHVLSVVSPRVHAETSAERLATLDEARSQLVEQLTAEEFLDERGDAPIAHVQYHDNPAEAIALFAQEHSFDLVVVGTHGRDQITHRGVGRSVEILIRTHPCPVLVV
ncbi:MAG: universal stress protein [Acidimicrobiales bacterium]